MTCEPHCNRCGGNLGHPANGDWTCAKCKLNVLADCFDAEAQALTTSEPKAMLEAMARAYRAAAAKMRDARS